MGGQNDYRFLRRQAYRGADVVLLCFPASASSFSTAESLLTRWKTELDDEFPAVPIILVGIDNDADSQRPEQCSAGGSGSEKVSLKELERWALADRIGAVAYMYCDLPTCVGVDDIFELVG